MNRRLSQVALSAAAALTLSLAAPVAAQATESAGASLSSATATTTRVAKSTFRASSVSAAQAPVVITTFKLARGYSFDHRITPDTNVSTRLAIGDEVARGYSLREFTADLFISNRRIGPVTFSPTASSLNWTKRHGYGVAQLRNLRATVYFSGVESVVPLGTPSNSFRIRRDFDRNLQMKVTKRGSKKTIRATKWRVNQPNGKYATVRKVKLQRLKGGKWRNFKTIKVNKSGNGKVSFKSKKKYKYRLAYSTTNTIAGARTYASPKM